MFNANLVSYRYDAIAGIFFFQAVLFHILFGAVLYLVWNGNRKPGWRLMSLAFASMAFTVLYAALSEGLYFTGVAFIVLMICAAHDVAQPLTAWGPGNDRPLWVRRVAVLALIWAWIYPHHVVWWKTVFGSPLGVLPSPTLFALLALLWLAFPQTNRLLHWAATILGLFYGLYGLVILHVVSDVVLLALAGIALRDLLRSVRESGGLFEEDLTPQEKPKPATERAKKDQVWRL